MTAVQCDGVRPAAPSSVVPVADARTRTRVTLAGTAAVRGAAARVRGERARSPN